MAIINQNIRYLRTREGLSQQKFADLFGVNRGNIDSYEKTTQPNLDFLMAVANHFDINMQMLYAEEMTDYTFDRFKTQKLDSSAVKDSGEEEYKKYKKSDFFTLMLQIKEEQNADRRRALVDKAMIMHTQLEDENRELQNNLIEWVRDMNKI